MIDLDKTTHISALPKHNELKTSHFRTPIFNPQNLETFDGSWTYETAAHLLRRTVFGPSFTMIEDAVTMGMEATLDTLLSGETSPGPPLNYNYNGDPEVPVGETWINASYDRALMNGYRERSMRGWIFGLMLNQGISIIEKMVLFWHNHFVVANVNDARFLYRYNDTLRKHCLGNFKELTKQITIDPAMLRYLNGNQNTLEAPNENYARELLELFTVGKGELAGPGDYTTFTEQDVEAMAKVLTGWRDFGFRRPSEADQNIGSFFRPSRHAPGAKQLSPRFGNTVINNNGENEYNDLIEVIFQQEVTSKFICRKLYRWFVYYEISDQVESDVIEPMAAMLRENDYEIKPALKALLSSKHYYDESIRACMIKSPIDFVVGVINQFNIRADLNLSQEYRYWLRIFEFNALLQMEYFNHPTVAGWKAYYQEPSFYRTWINSVTLPLRQNITDVISYVGTEIGNQQIIIDVFTLVASLDNPLDVNAMISDIAKIVLPQPLTEKQQATLKEVILPGLPDFEWTVEYSNYLANPGDEDIKRSVEQKLRLLMLFMLRMPEYHLS